MAEDHHRVGVELLVGEDLAVGGVGPLGRDLHRGRCALLVQQGHKIALGVVHRVPRLAVAAAAVAAGDLSADDQARAAGERGDPLARDPRAHAQAGLGPVGLDDRRLAGGERRGIAVAGLDALEGGEGAEDDERGDERHGGNLSSAARGRTCNAARWGRHSARSGPAR